MTLLLGIALLTGLAAGLLTNLLVPLITRLAVSVRALDYPGGRRHQVRPVPRLGGVAIVAGLGLGAGGTLLARWNEWGATAFGQGIHRSQLLVLLVSTVMVFLVGVIDDVIGVSSLKKFLLEVLAAVLLTQAGWSFEVLSLPGGGGLSLGVLGPVVSVLWIVGVTNAVNLLDGLDGLASGVVAIIAASLLVFAMLLSHPGSVVLLSAISGACLGFLRHNWSPAKIYMGDSGSLTLGFLLAVMSVHSAIKAPAAVAILVPLLALGVPVIDTVLVMLVRFLQRPKGPWTSRFLAMFRADRNHLHHLLLHYGASRQRVVAWIYGAVLAFCLLAVVVALTQNPLLGAVLLPVEIAVIWGMRRFGLGRRASVLSRFRRDELKHELEGEAPEEDERLRAG
jgi:UDP-GlcNAc:undecaprenyl-phosphate/decaprenyl-phosphate GlcNAc-1-phosphate transferase